MFYNRLIYDIMSSDIISAHVGFGGTAKSRALKSAEDIIPAKIWDGRISMPWISKKIYDIIKENPYISTKDISETIGNITADGVRYHINKLKKLGVLERVGADKGGYWKIKSWK